MLDDALRETVNVSGDEYVKEDPEAERPRCSIVPDSSSTSSPRFGRSGSVSTGSYKLTLSGLGIAVALGVEDELRLEGDEESVLRSAVSLEYWLLRDTVDMMVMAEDKVHKVDIHPLFIP